MRLALCLLAALSLAGAAQAQGAYKAPRNAFGQPDLSGVWTNASLTQLQRMAQYKTLTIPEAEAQKLEKQRAAGVAAQSRPTDPNAPAPRSGGDPGGYNNFWTDPGATVGRINGEARTSWIVEPADGKLPWKPEGYSRYQKTMAYARGTFDGPEVRPLGERCILGFGSTAGPPMLNVLYNNNYQIQQSKDSIAIVVEMNHDARIIRMGSRQHLPAHITPWMGDSVGWWEGDTLVVETTNFNPGESLRPYFDNSLFLSPQAKVTERFTRVSPTQILYEFQVDDPAVFAKVWKAQMPLNASKGQVFEYACHEGNYALPGILGGARRAEAEGRAPEAVDLGE